MHSFLLSDLQRVMLHRYVQKIVHLYYKSVKIG
nr:MAG TPA: hypothetical protein [Caudoviricetes sp.]